MIDLSEEPVAYNIETTAKYLKRVAPLKVSILIPHTSLYVGRRGTDFFFFPKQWLEMEIGITGGEEDVRIRKLPLPDPTPFNTRKSSDWGLIFIGCQQ